MSESTSRLFSSTSNKKLSLYRTQNNILHFTELKDLNQLPGLIACAQSQQLPIYYLGNGSNTLFEKKIITTAVIKNSLPKEITDLGNDHFYISSSVLVSEVLKYCLARERDCFYYLASVPAEVDGAVAMNAGQARSINQSIFDFIVSLKVFRDGNLVDITPAEAAPLYRKTTFTGIQSQLIVGATFRFPVDPEMKGNPVRERIAWAREHQELSAPNCGSVFSKSDNRIMFRLRGLKVGSASYSKKNDNWIINKGDNPRDIIRLIQIARCLHRICFLKCETEVIGVR